MASYALSTRLHLQQSTKNYATAGPTIRQWRGIREARGQSPKGLTWRRLTKPLSRQIGETWIRPPIWRVDFYGLSNVPEQVGNTVYFVASPVFIVTV